MPISLTGPLIVRKRPLPDAQLPAGLCEHVGPDGALHLTLACDFDAMADFQAGFEYANKRFDEFKLSGGSPRERLVLKLFALGYGSGYKLPPAFWSESSMATEHEAGEQEFLGRIVSYLQRIGRAYKLPRELQELGVAEKVLEAKCREFNRLAEAEGFKTSVYASNSSLSLYLEVRAPGSEGAALQVRFSDHGSATARFCIGLDDPVQAVFEAVRVELQRGGSERAAVSSR